MLNQFTVRPASVEADVASIVKIITTCSTEQTTFDEVCNWMQASAPGRIAYHKVCTNEQGDVIGYGNAIHTASSPDNLFYAWVAVLADFRRQGAGLKLWDCLQEEMHSVGAREVFADVLEEERDSLAFAQRQGFVIDRHKFHSFLDLTTFDETPFLPVIAGLEAQGMRFCTLADLPDDDATRQKYYELNLATVRDIPGEYWDFAGYPAFFEKQILGATWFRREGQILALDGENFAGFASVSLRLDGESAYNATTGVQRAYRGRQIGLALKVLAARYARQNGRKQIITDNDSLNAPVLAINRKMGYQPQPGHYLLKWTVTEA